jgi:hypothetical protein
MMQIHRMGTRAALICSDAFVPMAKVQCKLFHIDLPLIVVKHPVGGLSLEEVGERAGQALPQLLRLLESV